MTPTSTPTSSSPLRMRFDAFELDEGNARLTRGGQPVALPPKAFAVLCALARQPGQLVTKNVLLDTVWGHQHISESVLKTVISELRSALADDAKRPRFIETASRLGYRFIGREGAPGIGGASGPPGAPAAPSAAIATASPLVLPTLIGRAGGLRQMQVAWEATCAGTRQLVLVGGDAGIGKTTLIDGFAGSLPEGVAVRGHCVEHFGTGEPYLPLLEVMRELCRIDPALVEVMRQAAPTWVLQMPWLTTEADRMALHREVSGAHPDRMVREFLEMIARYTAERPLVIVLEDMHWSDGATLRAMEHFAKQTRPGRLLWIASFRLAQIVAEDHPLRDLRQDLRLKRLCREILLDPFSEQDVADYLETRAAGRVPETLVRRLHAHTNGLPLFLANVTETLLAQTRGDAASLESWLAEAAAGTLPVPDNLSGAIEKQARRLAPGLQQTLEAASVCGAEFRAGTVARLLDGAEEQVREQCDALVRQSWLRDLDIVERADGDFDTRYAFQHALHQHVLYRRMAIARQVQLHRRLARILVELKAAGEDVPLAEIGSHFERGRETVAALRTYAEAAGSALGRFAPQDAYNLAQRGLALLDRVPPGEERSDCELNLIRPRGVAASLMFGVGSSEALCNFERARVLCDELPQTPARAVALNGIGWVFYVRGDFREALDLAERVAEIARVHADPVLSIFACNLAGVALVGFGRLEEGCAALERGIQECRQMGDRVPLTAFVIDPEVSMHMNIVMPLYDRALEEQAREHLRLGAERARRIGQPIAQMLVAWCGGMLEVRADDVEAVAVHAARLDRIVETAVMVQGIGPGLWLRGWVRARGGQPREGLQDILAGYASHARHGMYSGCPEVLAYATEALVLAGDWDAARAQCRAALELSQRIGERLVIGTLKLLEARIAQAGQDVVAARAALHAALEEARYQGALRIEIKALVALHELDGDTAERDELTAALGRALAQVTEGRQSPLFQRAAQLASASAT